jgi:hypothetical protein
VSGLVKVFDPRSPLEFHNAGAMGFQEVLAIEHLVAGGDERFLIGPVLARQEVHQRLQPSEQETNLQVGKGPSSFGRCQPFAE